MAFYNHRGTCEQYIKEGKGAVKWTRLSCRSFAANAVRLQLHALAYNLGNFMRTLAMPKTAEPWSLTSLRAKLIKIGAKVVSHGRYVTFQMAEVAVSRQMFADILSLIARLRAHLRPHRGAWSDVRCDRRRRQRCASMQANHRVLAPRRNQLGWFGRLPRTRCAFSVAEDAHNGRSLPTTTRNWENVGTTLARSP